MIAPNRLPARLEAVLYDLRLAIRYLLRDRSYAATVIATLALGVGLNVTVFVVMNAMLFRGFPLVERNDRLVGRTVEIDKTPATVIGVMPEGFDFPEREDLWMPVVRTAALERRQPTPRGFMAFGRLARGATLADARAELGAINGRLAADYPASNRGVVPAVRTARKPLSVSPLR